MPGSDLNYHQITAAPKGLLNFQDGGWARQTMHSWALTVAITRAIIGSWRSKGDKHLLIDICANRVCTLKKLRKCSYVVDVEATLFRFDAGVGPAGTTPSQA
eukprot:6855-Pleurochrysis_carterae.AAC.1